MYMGCMVYNAVGGGLFPAWVDVARADLREQG